MFATCYGTNLISPKDGYFRPDLNTEHIYKCYKLAACLAGSRNDLKGKCAKGYDNFLCGTCSNNYVMLNRSCKECPDHKTNIFLSVVRALCICILLIFIVNLQTSIAEDGNHHYAFFILSTKLFINFSIIMSAIQNIDFKFSYILGYIIETNDFLMRTCSNFLRFDCLLNSGYEAGDPLDQNRFFKNLIIVCLSPVIFFIIFAIYVFIQTKRKEQTFKVFKIKLIGLFNIMFWIFYNDICNVVFASFTCVDKDSTGVQRLLSDTSI